MATREKLFTIRMSLAEMGELEELLRLRTAQLAGTPGAKIQASDLIRHLISEELAKAREQAKTSKGKKR